MEKKGGVILTNIYFLKSEYEDYNINITAREDFKELHVTNLHIFKVCQIKSGRK